MRSIVGSEISPMVTTVAPTIPVLAAISAPTTTTARPSPPGMPRMICASECSNWSASFDRSSMTPMNTNTGTAISVSLVMMPNTRFGKASRNTGSKCPVSDPMPAKISATPASVNATG
ncbi:MAG: hypothetical protein P8Y54_07485 [Xanthomonadales bacterium]